MPIHDWTRVNAGTFQDFHQEWLLAIKHVLNHGVLPADYYALTDQIAGGLHPDILTLEHEPPPRANGSPGSSVTSRGGGIALETVVPRVRFTATSESEAYARKRRRLVIRHASDDRAVAVVEVVSSGNKANRHAMRALVDKAAELLAANIHLLILDLFPPGPHDSQGIHGAIWSEIGDDAFRLPADKRLTLVAYAAGDQRTAYVEPVAVGDELPEMPLFLEPNLYVLVPLARLATRQLSQKYRAGGRTNCNRRRPDWRSFAKW